MKILRKYVLGQLIVPFIFSVGIFTFMFVIGSMVKLADLLINKGVNILDVAKLLVFMLPEILTFTIPMGALTAVLLVFGGFAQNNEIIAMKTSGVNIFRIMIPVVLASFLISVFSLFVNDQLFSKSSYAYRKDIKEIFFRKPSAFLEAGRFIKEFKNYVILIQEIHGNKLKGVTIYQTEEDNKPIRTIIAESGEIVSSPKDKVLSIKLYDGTIDEANANDPNVFYKLDFKSIVLPQFFVGDQSPDQAKINKKTRELNLDELITRYPKEHEKQSRLQIISEIFRKITISLAPTVFVLIGLPLALITRRGEPIIGFGIALALVSIYYVFFVCMYTVALQGKIPPVLVLCLPDLSLAVIGSYLLFRVVRV